MTLNPLGALLPAAGSASGASILPCVTGAVRGAALGVGGSSLSNLTSELTSGLGDDASSTNMLSQLAATLGNLVSSNTASVSSGVIVPTSTSSLGQQFRSYGSLQQAQQGASNGDATLVSLISGRASDATDNA